MVCLKYGTIQFKTVSFEALSLKIKLIFTYKQGFLLKISFANIK